MAYQSEAQLEQLLIDDLVKRNYEQVTLPDLASLELNFRKQLNQFNLDKLENKELSDKEFDRLMIDINGKSVFQSAKILRDKILLKRDDGTDLYLELIDTKNYKRNIFQVTSQVTVVGKYTNRYDVTLLINGLPLIQIELKRRGMDIKEAFNQIERYRKHSYQGLYRYIQAFVVSNGVDTKYFANTDKELLYSLSFFWTDEENTRLTNLQDFSQAFFDQYHLIKMIGRYTVLNDTDKNIMILRPYQVYAVEAVTRTALDTTNGGYIWHTTGSGKTLTSFKVSQIIAQEPSVKKVLFVVDRSDLDDQTTKEFNKFEEGSVDGTDSTKALVNQIQDKNRSLIVTTMQKLSNAVNNKRYTNILEEFKTEKVIIIFDECHRSTFGDMLKDIKKHFTKAQLFGFTGTPRFIENKSQDGRTTADLFGKCLHHYLIREAILDNNVLGFSVEYIQTYKGQYDENDDTLVPGIDTDEVLLNEERISLVSNHIVQHHNLKTRNRQYTAIFATQSILMLQRYYDEFRKIDHNLKIAAVFSYGTNEESEGRDEHSRDVLERIIGNYNKEFQTAYGTETYAAYNKDVSKRVKTAQIDILIVVNMYLTGFDSKPLNTLYVDKFLKYHDLIQAFSRTNRVEKSTKPFGNIVCYRNLKANTDAAVLLFSRTDKTDDVLLRDYKYYLAEFKDSLASMLKIAFTPADVDKLESEEDKQKFIIAFRELSKILLVLNTFTEFEFNEAELDISEQEYQDFKSKYLLIYETIKRTEEKVSILNDIDFGIEMMATDRINVSYIMNLIRNINLDDEKQRDKDIKHIHTELDRTDNLELRKKVELLKKFLHDIIPKLSKDDSIDDAYIGFENIERNAEIEAFASEQDVDVDIVRNEISEFEFTGIIHKETIANEIQKPFLEKRRITNAIIDFIKTNVEKYQ
jgi:type I restriction enzyme R subunit